MLNEPGGARAQKKAKGGFRAPFRILYSAAPVCETAYVPAVTTLKRSEVRE